MKISTKGRYALRMMIDLAEHETGGYIPLKDIAKRQGISKKYLEQIVLDFNKSNFLSANRGSQGGYKLSYAPEKYTVADILKCAEGNLFSIDCIDNNSDCANNRDCSVRYIWQGLDKAINDYLKGITLKDIINKKREDFVNDYVI